MEAQVATPEMLLRLVDSMPKRLEELKKAKWGAIIINVENCHTCLRLPFYALFFAFLISFYCRFRFSFFTSAINVNLSFFDSKRVYFLCELPVWSVLDMDCRSSANGLSARVIYAAYLLRGLADGTASFCVSSEGDGTCGGSVYLMNTQNRRTCCRPQTAEKPQPAVAKARRWLFWCFTVVAAWLPYIHIYVWMCL